MVGLLQIGMGLVKLGFVANLLSRPVITGLTAAAALIIAASQLGNLLGMELGRSQYVHVLIYKAFQRAEAVHILTLAIGLGSIGLLLAIQRWAPLLPGALIVVMLGEVTSWGLGFQAEGVRVVGTIPAGLPPLEWPGMGGIDLRTLLPTAITLALVQFMNVVSLGRVFATRHNYAIDANRELLSIGAGNLLGSFFQSIPSAGSFSRSAVNERAGARTPFANVAAALVIALTLLFLTPLFYYLPMPVLAAIIMVAGAGLIDLNELGDLFRTRRRDGFIALFTAGCTLLIGIQEGILLGIGATMLMVLYRISRPNVAELGHVPGTRLFRDMDRFDRAEHLTCILVLRVDAAFSFANAEYFKDFILEKSQRVDEEIRTVVIDGTSINDLDTTAIEALRSVVEALDEEGIELYFTGLIGPVREVVIRSGLFDRLGEEHFQMSPHDAVVHILQEWDEGDEGDRVPHYFAQTEQRTPPTPAGA